MAEGPGPVVCLTVEAERGGGMGAAGLAGGMLILRTLSRMI